MTEGIDPRVDVSRETAPGHHDHAQSGGDDVSRETSQPPQHSTRVADNAAVRSDAEDNSERLYSETLATDDTGPIAIIRDEISDLDPTIASDHQDAPTAPAAGDSDPADVSAHDRRQSATAASTLDHTETGTPNDGSAPPVAGHDGGAAGSGDGGIPGDDPISAGGADTASTNLAAGEPVADEGYVAGAASGDTGPTALDASDAARSTAVTTHDVATDVARTDAHPNTADLSDSRSSDADPIAAADLSAAGATPAVVGANLATTKRASSTGDARSTGDAAEAAGVGPSGDTAPDHVTGPRAGAGAATSTQLDNAVDDAANDSALTGAEVLDSADPPIAADPGATGGVALRADDALSRDTTGAVDDDTTDVSRETTFDTPIAREAQQAVHVLNVRQEHWPRPDYVRVMTVANQKGGVGKTTSAVNVAAALALHGLRVMVIDLDPQGNASTALGIEHGVGTPSIYDVLLGGSAIADVAQATEFAPTLLCVPATLDLAGADIELTSQVAREYRLQKALQTYLDDNHSAIDYVIIDCPPSLGLLTLNALVAGREMLIPIQCEYYALEGLAQLLSTVELVKSHLNPQLAVTTVLLTMYDSRTRLADQVADEVRSHFGELVLTPTIPRNVRVSEAPGFGQTVMTYDAGSRGAVGYLQAAREVAERGRTVNDGQNRDEDKADQ